MNEITIDTSKLNQRKGLNKYSLLQGVSQDTREQYEAVLDKVEGSLTTVSDNDAQSKIKVAITNLAPTAPQANALIRFQESFKSIENQIDPERLSFDIDKAADDEICIYRNSSNGVTNIVINDDGSIAFSFIAYKHSAKQDFLTFYDEGEEIDCESLALKFFSL